MPMTIGAEAEAKLRRRPFDESRERHHDRGLQLLDGLPLRSAPRAAVSTPASIQSDGQSADGAST